MIVGCDRVVNRLTELGFPARAVDWEAACRPRPGDHYAPAKGIEFLHGRSRI
jgi:hypothetical protein